MHRVFVSTSLLILGLQVASASPVACTAGSLSTYLSLGSSGCSIGDLTFTNFSSLALEPNATLIAPSSIMVAPSAGGFEFTFNVMANANQLFDSVYGFDVTSTSLGLIGDSLNLSGSSATNDGAATGIEISCIGALAANGTCSGAMAGRNLAVYSLSGITQTSDSISFSPNGVIGVTLDLSANGGTSGSAILGAAAAQFSESAVATPEPGTLSLMAALSFVLAAFAFGARLFRNSSSRRMQREV